MKSSHGGFVFLVAFFLGTHAIQDFYGRQILFLAWRWGFGLTSFGGRRQVGKNFAGSSEILLVPDRMISRHGFAPIGHREIGINFLRATEVLCSVVVFKVMELREAAQEVGLGSGRAGVGERYLADRG